jgi:hypothetical protein
MFFPITQTFALKKERKAKKTPLTVKKQLFFFVGSEKILNFAQKYLIVRTSIDFKLMYAYILYK